MPSYEEQIAQEKRQERVKEVLEMKEALAAIGQQEQSAAEYKTLVDTLEQTRQQMGLGVDEFRALMFSDPQARLEVIREQAAEIPKRLLAKRAKAVAGQQVAQSGQTSTAPVTATDKATQIAQAQELQKAGRISSQEYTRRLFEAVSPKTDPIWQTETGGKRR